MRMAVDRCSQKSLQRLLGSCAGYAFRHKQASERAKKLKIDQRRSIHIRLPSQARPNWTVDTLVKEGADPYAGIGHQHLCPTGSGELLELARRDRATGDQARTRQRLLHRGPSSFSHKDFACERCQGQAPLGGALAERLQGIVWHIPDLEGRRHAAPS